MFQDAQEDAQEEARDRKTRWRGACFLVHRGRGPGIANLVGCTWRPLDALLLPERVARHHVVPPAEVAQFCTEDAAGARGCWVWEFAGARTFHDIMAAENLEGVIPEGCDHFDIKMLRGAQIWAFLPPGAVTIQGETWDR